MGRIGRLFKKSDDKEKPPSPSPSNPYAQQQPPADPYSSPPPDYNQFNQNQYNGNQYISQQAQGPPSGLPAGPRPGGLPSKVAPGPPRMGTWESNKTAQTAPPRYSEQSGGSPGPPSYGNGSPSLASAGNSPALSSSAASPSMGSGYPREKYGALDGVGRNRFEPPAPSQYGRPAGSPSQQQGGYGNLDEGSGGLFAGYNGAPKQTTSPNLAQSNMPYGAAGEFDESQPMTEEERERAEVEGLKMQIEQEQAATNDVGRRNVAMLTDANARMRAMNGQLRQDWDTLRKAERNMDETNREAKVGGVNLDDLDASRTTMFNLAANSKRRIAQRAEKKMTIQRQYQSMQEQADPDDDVDRKWEAERQQLQAAKPKGLLGSGSKKTDFSKFEFEDDSGNQRAMNEEYDDIVDNLLVQSSELHEQAEFQTFMLNQQLKQIDRISDKAQTADDHVAKNRFRLETKHNR